jgi:hypothetical protein
MIVVYRPPPNAINKLTVNQLFEEFSSFRLCIVGDFNFHVDNLQNFYATKFCNLLETFDLLQRVRSATHEKGHTLDLVITHPSDLLIEDLSAIDMQMSDHHWIHCNLPGPKPKTARKEITFRKMKSIDVAQFKADIESSTLTNMDTYESTDRAVSEYNSELSKILNKHAPMIKKNPITLHPEALGYNEEVDLAKKDRRKAESEWRKSSLTVHREIFIEKK